MRILGFSKKWDKLNSKTFTTFRLPRKDACKGRDWKEGETVQIVYRPRSKDREIICIAKIIEKTQCRLQDGVTDADAIADGFSGRWDMLKWLEKTHGKEAMNRFFNKLTLKREAC